MKLTSTKSRVLHLLRNGGDLFRDDYNAVLAELWKEDIEALDKDTKEISGYMVLKLVCMGKLSNPESIRRNWQKHQEQDPSLRGKGYKRRHKVNDPEVRQEVINFNN